MNVSQLLIPLLIFSLPLSVVAQKTEPCKEALHSYRNIERQALKKVEASYPNERGVRVKGTVVVLIKVGRRGNVISAHAICGHPLLMSSSVASAMKWKFQPRRVNGRLVNNVGIITFDFRPADTKSVRTASSL